MKISNIPKWFQDAENSAFILMSESNSWGVSDVIAALTDDVNYIICYHDKEENETTGYKLQFTETLDEVTTSVNELKDSHDCLWVYDNEHSRYLQLTNKIIVE